MTDISEQPMRAAFSLANYTFVKSSVDLENIAVSGQSHLKIRFNPSGIFDSGKNIFRLFLEFTASDESGNDMIYVKLLADYKFQEDMTFENIPSYFYANSVAIIFPYVRAFVSTLTLQSNITPIIIPTFNVSYLQDILKKHTEEGVL